MTDKDEALPRVKDIKMSFGVESLKYEIEFFEGSLDLTVETFYDEPSDPQLPHRDVAFREKPPVEKMVFTVYRPIANQEGFTHILKKTEIDNEGDKK